MQVVTLAVVVGGAAWLWIDVIGDLGKGTHVAARHADEARKDAPSLAMAALTSVPVGAGLPESGDAGPPLAAARHPGVRTVDPVAEALLAAARDHLARKVAATGYVVEDARANKGHAFDLIDRGLGGFLPLRIALLRHRLREPQRYGLASKPPATHDERRRALTSENLAIFLDSFADRVALKPAVATGSHESAFEAGDLVVVQRKKGSGRVLVAVVSDTVDDAHRTQIVTLDPRDGVAREQPLTGVYVVREHFRLRNVHLARIRSTLDLAPTPPAGTAL